MPMPLILSTACQNAVIKAAANLTAQLAARWHSDHPAPLDRQRIFEFAVFGFLGALIGFKWHRLLEDTFPTRDTGSGLPRIVIASPVTQAPPHHHHFGEKDDAGKAGVQLQQLGVPGAADGDLPVGGRAPAPGPGIRWRNVWAKLVADQTVGLSVMISLFLFVTHIARQPSLADVFAVIWAKLFGLVWAGWHIWPAVAIINFLWVPVRWRVLVGSFVGFGWNIFLSFHSMKATGASGAPAPVPAPGPELGGRPPAGGG